MLSKIISIIFAVIAGAAALIGLSTGRDRLRTSSRNDLQPSETLPNVRSVPQTTLDGSTTDATITDPPATAEDNSSPSPIFTVQGESTESTPVAQTSSETATELDPSPAPAAPEASASAPAPAPAPAPEVSTAPAASTSAPASAPVAPAPAPAQPVKAMW